MIFINQTETIGQIIGLGATNVTGDILSVMFFILLFLLAIGFMFGIPLEFMSVLILPFCLAVGAFYNFYVPIIFILIYVSVLIAKNWIFR